MYYGFAYVFLQLPEGPKEFSLNLLSHSFGSLFFFILACKQEQDTIRTTTTSNVWFSGHCFLLLQFELLLLITPYFRSIVSAHATSRTFFFFSRIYVCLLLFLASTSFTNSMWFPSKMSKSQPPLANRRYIQNLHAPHIIDFGVAYIQTLCVSLRCSPSSKSIDWICISINFLFTLHCQWVCADVTHFKCRVRCSCCVPMQSF